MEDSFRELYVQWLDEEHGDRRRGGANRIKPVIRLLLRDAAGFIRNLNKIERRVILFAIRTTAVRNVVNERQRHHHDGGLHLQ